MRNEKAWPITMLAMILLLVTATIIIAMELTWTQGELEKTQQTVREVKEQNIIIDDENKSLQKKVKKLTGTYAGTYSYTYYCSACNSPAGSTATSYGYYEPGYTVACNDFELGQRLRIVKDGESGIYMVTDRMGRSGVIDFASSCDGWCDCSGTGECEVYIL